LSGVQRLNSVLTLVDHDEAPVVLVEVLPDDAAGVPVTRDDHEGFDQAAYPAAEL